MKLSSPEINEGEVIPTIYTGDGLDTSPPLDWSIAPKGTHSFSMLCDDPDAPQAEPWVHWLIYNIPASATGLPRGMPRLMRIGVPFAATQGLNSFGRIGYNGPLPPYGHGWHRYFFKVYALDTVLALAPGAAIHQWLAAIKGHILAEAVLMGRYQREAVRRPAA